MFISSRVPFWEGIVYYNIANYLPINFQTSRESLPGYVYDARQLNVSSQVIHQNCCGM